MSVWLFATLKGLAAVNATVSEKVLFVRVWVAAIRVIVSEATFGSVCCRAAVGPIVGAIKFCPAATVMPALKVCKAVHVLATPVDAPPPTPLP